MPNIRLYQVLRMANLGDILCMGISESPTLLASAPIPKYDLTI